MIKERKDKKFVVAVVVIVVLAAALLYVTVLSPRIQGYFIQQEVNAQQATIQTILQIVDQQGYVVLGDEQNQVVLVQYQPNAEAQQELQQPIEQPTEEIVET